MILGRKHKLLIGGGVLAVLMLLRTLLFFHHLDEPLRIDAPYLLEVGQGSNFTRIARELQSAGVLNAAGDLLLYARVQKLANQIKAGEYELLPGQSGRDLLQTLVRGDVKYHQVTVVEGWTLRQALQAIQAHPAVATVLDIDDQDAIAQAFVTPVYPEGQVFPDTYSFIRGTTDLEILQRARTLMRQVLEEAWAGRAAGLPYASIEEALVMASIVEKESAVPGEAERVAGVFVRRLQRNMRLQTDPTVIYGLGTSFDGNLTRAHLQQDTPWNTYVHEGLPPTPIALPGRSAIDASLHPDDSENLYFVAKGDGSHYFSATLEEHNRAVEQYQLGNSQE